MGRFQIIRKLGEGGMASVYLATRGEGAFRKQVAIKKMKRQALLDPAQVDLFLREVRVTSQLNHPGVVQVYDAGVEEDRPYLELEYVDGPDLDTVIDALYQSREQLSPALVAHVGARVCEALSYVYAQRDETGGPLITAHRDISPSNVLVSSQGHVKLTDFGVVRLATSATAIGVVKGKWEYFPPEIITGKPQDVRGDLFALGITLYKLFALVHPFHAPTPQEHFQRARTESPSRPAGMPEGLWKPLRQALERDPARRFANPEQLGMALEAFIVRAGETANARLLAERLASLPLSEAHGTEHVSLAEVDLGDADDGGDGRTLPDVDRVVMEARARAMVQARQELPEPTTDIGVPTFASARPVLTRAAPPQLEQAMVRRLYRELREARLAAGFSMDLPLEEFAAMLNKRHDDLRAERPEALVRFELGERHGKPVVVPKVSTRR